MSKQVRFNPKRDIPFLSMGIQAVLMGYAGSILIGGLEGWLVGGLLGILVSVSVLYASSQYAGTAKERKPWIICGLAILMLFSPVITGTAMYLHLSGGIDPIWRGVVSLAFAILPDVAGGVAGFVAGKGMVKQDDAVAQVAQAAKKEKKVAKKLRKPITDNALIAELRRNPGATDDEIAGVFGVSRQAINQRRRKLTPADLGLIK